jgi:hypothetical protein
MVVVAVTLNACSSTAPVASATATPITWREVTRSKFVLTRVDSVLFEQYKFLQNGSVKPVVGTAMGRYEGAPLAWRLAGDRLQLWNHGKLYTEYTIVEASPRQITIRDQSGVLTKYRMSNG